jgi:Dynein light intermediate chain (DLIC)
MRRSLLRPAGWDNQKKISILYENMQSCKAEDDFNDIIAQPPSRKTVSNREIEVVTEDEQVFLARQQQLLQQGQSGQPARSVSPMRNQQAGGKASPRTPGNQGSPSKKVRRRFPVRIPLTPLAVTFRSKENSLQVLHQAKEFSLTSSTPCYTRSLARQALQVAPIRFQAEPIA